MKNIILPICLLLTACVAPTDAPNTTSTAITTAPVAVAIPTRPNASNLGIGVTATTDEQLSGEQLRTLVQGKTVYSQKLSNASETQVGSFRQDGSMQVSTNGQTIDGNWSIKGNQLCYLLGGKEFCSSVHRSVYDFASQPIYYFRRATGEATVVITGIT